MNTKVAVIGSGAGAMGLISQAPNHFAIDVYDKASNTSGPLAASLPLTSMLMFGDEEFVIPSTNYSSFGRSIPFFESNILGGATSINGGVAAFGDKELWDGFLSERTNFSSFNESVALAFDSITDCYGVAKLTESTLDKAFFKSSKQVVPKLTKGNTLFSGEQIYGSLHTKRKRWIRQHISVLLNGHKCLKFYTGIEVIRVESHKGGCSIVLSNGERRFYEKVILSGGCWGTHDILSRSVPELYSSDRQLWDHPNLRINVDANYDFGSLNTIEDSLVKKICLGARYLFDPNSLMASPGATSCFYIDLDDDGKVDAKVQLLNFSEEGRLGSKSSKMFCDSPGFSLAITLIRDGVPCSYSYGSNGCDSGINMNIDSKTINLYQSAIEICLRLLELAPLSDLVKEVRHKKDLINQSEKYIRDNIYSGYHLIGGHILNDFSLLNKNFQFKPIKNLYIVDASCFDRFVSPNIEFPSIALGSAWSKHMATEIWQS